MTEFQHPADQGSTAEDFLAPHNPYPMYQYSVFLNGGRDEQLVVRAATFAELLAGKRNINKVLDKVDAQNGATNGYGQTVNNNNGQTVNNGNGQTVNNNNGQTVNNGNGRTVCQHHETKIFTVRKEGINQGREFKSCTQCREFLGFV